MEKNDKQWLISELERWMKNNDGKTPRSDDMKAVDGYPSAYQFKKVFKTSKWNEILKEVGLKPNNQFWTSREERFIKQNWMKLSDQELADVLDKTHSSISYIRNELGLYRQKQKQEWVEWEIKYLQENFYETDKKLITEALYPRKWETIRAFATKKLRLKRKHSQYKYQLGNNQRFCQYCLKVFPETPKYFYRDENSFRTLCINCYNDKQEKMARERGALTRKLKKEMLEKGFSRCSSCDAWKRLEDFRLSNNDLNQIHRYCEECEKKYHREYHLQKKYGENFEELYFDENKQLFDINGIKWDSIDEVFITNWLCTNGYKVEKGPYYSKVFKGESSKRKFDWIIYIENKEYLVEYFGWWDTNSNSEQFVKYTDKAKRKIKKLFKNKHSFNFIIIFPSDLKNKSLSQIFSSKTF